MFAFMRYVHGLVALNQCNASIHLGNRFNEMGHFQYDVVYLGHFQCVVVYLGGEGGVGGGSIYHQFLSMFLLLSKFEVCQKWYDNAPDHLVPPPPPQEMSRQSAKFWQESFTSHFSRVHCR